MVEVRAPADEDDRIIARLAGLDCRHERFGDTLYFYCDDGHNVMKRLSELELTNFMERPAGLEDVFLKLTGRSLIE